MRAARPNVLERAKTGDDGAFEELLRVHERRVMALAYRITGSVEDAQDAAQETFVRFHRELRSFGSAETAGAWLRRVVVNVCLDALRKRKMARAVPITDMDEGRHYHGRTPEAEAAARERERMLRGALLELGERERAAIVLRELEGMTTEEVAAVLGTSPATVRVQVAQARLKLARILRRDV